LEDQHGQHHFSQIAMPFDPGTLCMYVYVCMHVYVCMYVCMYVV